MLPWIRRRSRLPRLLPVIRNKYTHHRFSNLSSIPTYAPNSDNALFISTPSKFLFIPIGVLVKVNWIAILHHPSERGMMMCGFIYSVVRKSLPVLSLLGFLLTILDIPVLSFSPHLLPWFVGRNSFVKQCTMLTQMGFGIRVRFIYWFFSFAVPFLQLSTSNNFMKQQSQINVPALAIVFSRVQCWPFVNVLVLFPAPLLCVFEWDCLAGLSLTDCS